MKETCNKSKAEILRQKAETLLKKKPSKTALQLSEVEMLKLIYELEVHQIELELQYKQLRHLWAVGEVGIDKYTKLNDLTPSGNFTLSKEGKIMELNPCGSQMLGKERVHIKNTLFSFFVSSDTKPIFNLFLAKIFNSKTKELCELTLSSNGNLPMYVYLAGIVTENEEQCLVTIVDITERKLAEEEIKNKNEELLKLNAEKDKFFSIIAHDLRSPFNALLGFTQIMVEDLSTLTFDEIQKIAVNMRNSANKLFNLLENLLQWSLMQRGLISFKPESFILLNRIAPIIELVSDTAQKKMITISYDIPEDLRVMADGQMFESVMRNLVFNALKFTHKGGKISIEVKPISDNSVEISIRDTGIGMNKRMIDNLFLLDEQTNRKGTDGEPNTGLGLIICKDFIEKHGGQLWVESEEGQGTIFYFTIPYINTPVKI